MPVVDEDDEDDECWQIVPSLSPTPSPSQHPHATLPASHRSDTPAVLGVVFGILIALAACSFTARYVVRLRRRPATRKRLSDESWISPALPLLGSPHFEHRKLVPVTTPVCTPTDTEFGTRTDDPAIAVYPVRVPSPVYLSLSPSPSFSSSSLSPTPSTDPLPSSSLNTTRLSRLLSSTFADTHLVDIPARPTTAHLIQTARSYANAYRPSSTTSTSLYAPPTPSVRLAGSRSRTSFYPGERWLSTTVTVPHLQTATAEQPVGTPLGLKLRLSDASEHARYRLRERERREKNEFKLRDSESVLREIGW